jgi:hypothetical protein
MASIRPFLLLNVVITVDVWRHLADVQAYLLKKIRHNSLPVFTEVSLSILSINQSRSFVFTPGNCSN